MQKKYHILLSGGGTGGHIYPAISIADEFCVQFPEAEVLFVGAEGKMEMQKVLQAGYVIKGLWIAGLQRKLTLKNVMFPFKLMASLWNARKIIKEFQPDVVIGTGGYASAAVVKVAQLMNIPTIIQEQNSYPGITNKWLAPKAKDICVAYTGLERFFPKERIRLTGNPVRQDLMEVSKKSEEAQSFFGLNPMKKTLVVLGGSLGAKKINDTIAEHIEFFKQQNIQVLWQCGKNYLEEYGKYNDLEHISVFGFIERMDLIYAAADFIISRAGASSISELCMVGKPTVFIPSPNVAEDHQTHNAKSVVQENGAIMIREVELAADFQCKLERLFNDEEYAHLLRSNMRKLAKPNATKDIVECIKKYL